MNRIPVRKNLTAKRPQAGPLVGLPHSNASPFTDDGRCGRSSTPAPTNSAGTIAAIANDTRMAMYARFIRRTPGRFVWFGIVNAPTCQGEMHASASRVTARSRGARFDSLDLLCYPNGTSMPAPIPHEALARAVRAALGAEARVLTSTALAGDASSRRYVRLTLAGPGAPPTVVGMLLGPDRFPMGSDEIGAEGGRDELPFVNVGRYLARVGLPVPALVHDAAATDALLLVEDIGDTTLWAAAQAAPADAVGLF